MTRAKIWVFKSKANAEKTCAFMRRRGWAGARVAETSGGFVILVHDKGCQCGRCPALRMDGYVE